MSTFFTTQVVPTTTNPTGTITSQMVDIPQVQVGSVYVKLTGSLNCTAKLQISDDTTHMPNKDWTDMTGSTQALTGSFEYNLLFAGYRYLRVVLTGFTGTGTVSIFFTGK